VLAVVVAIFTAGLVWMRRLASVRTHERFLVGPETLARRAGTTDRTGQTDRTDRRDVVA